ncbi:MAG TPA: DUF2065 family protein [Allosphingosinicella sp.]|nr:DUF2065 family protein [Allosphingosinicella sp.]
MHTATPLTLHLLGAIGLYMVATGACALLAPDRWRTLAEEMERSPGLTIAIGLVTYAIGVALLGVHHGLADPPQILVTAIAAIAALEGLLILAVPRAMIAFGAPFLARPRAWAIVTLALGLAFILAGVFVPAGPTL